MHGRALRLHWIALLGVASLACAPGALDPPNVLLIVLDTTRGDRCSVHGYERPTTPSLERLAAEGATFDECWSPSPWTAPAHASLFTGLLPDRHGFVAEGIYYLRDEHRTLAELFRDAGYETGCFTANDYLSAGFGLTRGFDTVEPFYGRSFSRPTAAVAHDAAFDWLMRARRAGRPFFCLVNDMEPHAPYEPPEPIAARFASGAAPEELAAARAVRFPLTAGYILGEVAIPPDRLRRVSDLYDAEIATVDAAVGDLLDRLRAAGLLDDTIVVVTGDHGENLGDHGLMEHFFSVHRSVLHVPLVIRNPRAFPAGTTVRELVRLEDLPPTLLELCGMALPRPLDGRSLLRDLGGRLSHGRLGVSPHALRAAQEHFPGADTSRLAVSQRSVTDGRLHLIRYSDGREELYDLEADPREEVDLGPRGGELLERARRLLEAGPRQK